MCWAVQTTSYGPMCPVLLSVAFGPAVLNSLLLHPGIAALTSDHKNSYVFMRRCYLLFLMYITAYSFQSVSGEDDDDRQIYWALLFQPCCSMLACNIKDKKPIDEMRTCISPLLQKKKLRHRKGKKLAQGYTENKEFGSYPLQGGF